MRSSAIRWALGSVAVAALLFSPAVNAQERFSDIVGTVVDQSGGAIGGVTVTVTNIKTQRKVVLATAPNGDYYARGLEPGRYSLTFESTGFAAKEAPDVNLLLGKTLRVDATMLVGTLTETMLVVGETPLIDISATGRGHNVPAEEFETMPKGRSFQDLAASAPSVNVSRNFGGVEGGIQVNGASAGENNFIVDGVSVNSQLYGSQRQDAIFEHLQEVQVKTTGLAAEYGGALGGVISAVTKSGGNEWNGSLLYYYTGAPLMSYNGIGQRLAIEPVDQNDAQIIQDDDQSFNRHEVGGSIGGPLIRDQLFFFGSVVPRLESQTRNYQLSSGDTGSIKRDRTLWSAFGKLTWQTDRLRFNLSSLYTPDKSTGRIVGYDGYGSNLSTLTPDNIAARNTLGYEIPQYNVSATMDYTITPTTLFSIRGGYMHDNYIDTGIDTSQTFEYATSSVGLPGVAPEYQQPAGYANLPRTSFSAYDITTRKFINAEIFHAIGSHNIKAGGGFLRASNDVKNAYPNTGFVTVFWDQEFASNKTGEVGRGLYGYYTIDDLGTVGKTSGDIWSLFIQDSWRVSPRLILNLGLRAEHEKIPTFRPDIQETAIDFGWGDKLAPRIGFAWDVRGDGKMKLSAAWGRYFDWTKYELVRGSFGGDIWHTRYRSLDDPDPSKLSYANLSGRNLWDDQADSYQDWRIPSFGNDSIDPDIKPMGQDAFNVSLEYQVWRNTVVGVNYVHTHLLRTIEDLGTVVEGSEVYIYANPGEGLAAETPTQGLTTPFPTPKAKRNYDAVELSINRRFSDNWFLGGSYVWSRLHGNYAGTVSTDEIVAPGRAYAADQQAFGTSTRPGTNVSRSWDIDELMWDSRGNKGVNGLLPTDRPHVFKLYGSYQFGTGTTLGFNFYGGSGTPLSKTVWTIFQIPVLVDGRGSLGRTPFLSQTDIYVAQDLRLGGSKRLRLELNILNLFNQRQERHRLTSVNRIGGNGRRLLTSAIDLAGLVYGDGVDLAQGYDYQAMLESAPDADTPPGDPISGYQDPRYNMADIWNPGIQARFSIRFMF